MPMHVDSETFAQGRGGGAGRGIVGSLWEGGIVVREVSRLPLDGGALYRLLFGVRWGG